jgi:hypothetical protein
MGKSFKNLSFFSQSTLGPDFRDLEETPAATTKQQALSPQLGTCRKMRFGYVYIVGEI